MKLISEISQWVLASLSLIVTYLHLLWHAKNEGGNKNLKQPKKPTREQKKWIASSGYDWKDWSVVNEDNISVTIINKKTGRRKVVIK